MATEKQAAQRKAKAAKFMLKIKGDTADKVLHKVSHQVGPVTVHATKHSYDVDLGFVDDRLYEGTAKSLRAALMIALKKWQADQ